MGIDKKRDRYKDKRNFHSLSKHKKQNKKQKEHTYNYIDEIMSI